MKKDNKEEYSLRELVPYITGINYDDINREVNSFETDYRRVSRIYKILKDLGSIGSKEFSGIEYKKDKICEHERAAMINVIKDIYFDDKKNTFINQLIKPKGFNPHEFDEEEVRMFIDIFYSPFEYLEDKDFSTAKDEIRNYIGNIFNMETKERFHSLKATNDRVLESINYIESSRYRNEMMDQIDRKLEEIVEIILEYNTKQDFLNKISQNKEIGKEIRYKVEIEELPPGLQMLYTQVKKEIDKLK